MIGLIAHVGKPGASSIVQKTIACLQKHRAEFLAESKTAALVNLSQHYPVEELAERCSILLVLGGDGTILRVIHQISGAIPPIFGLNIGSLGFLTCFGPDEIEAAISSILTRDYVLSPRRLLSATVRHAGKISTHEALNEVLISRGERSQLVKVRVLIDGTLLTDYYADGLIVATPTGSTAYSLSAGGPILMPDCGALVITPICPHVLTNRSVVVADNSIITLIPCGDQEQAVFVTLDGHDAQRVAPDDRIEIQKSSRILPLAMLPNRSFSSILQQKLKWSGSNI
ncbi:MAG: NAD(+)/NADH kinase [Chthoniobacterales bacterium]|nr:NAD(+)/NADH kinase [Chthoniobacterales bacterium]MCX7713678.1 NAD(+)/NADH kinase [Chthoniobacterales bacterium]